MLGVQSDRAYVIEITLIAFPVPARFTFGRYAGRVFGFLSGSLLLLVLLYEITTLYAGCSVRSSPNVASARRG
jgi:hypothetical protein